MLRVLVDTEYRISFHQESIADERSRRDGGEVDSVRVVAVWTASTGGAPCAVGPAGAPGAGPGSSAVFDTSYSN